MKNPFLALLIVASAVISIAWKIGDIQPRHAIEIHGTIYEWRPYKGHYRDSIRSEQGFHPVTTTLYVRRVNWGYRGVMPVCDTLISDSLGNFTTELEEGEYNIFEAWQLEPLVMPMDSAGIAYDTACIREAYNEPAAKLHIMSGDSVDVVYFPRSQINRRCVIKSPTAVKIYGQVEKFGVPYENANHLESRPLPGMKFYVRQFWQPTNYIGPIIDSVVSDSAGKFSIELVPGHYSFISPKQASEIGLDKNFNPAKCDSICFITQLKAGDATFQVNPKDNVEVSIINPR